MLNLRTLKIYENGINNKITQKICLLLPICLLVCFDFVIIKIEAKIEVSGEKLISVKIIK